MSRLLALDQASKVTGWAIFEDGELKSYGKISLDDPNTDIRLVQLRQSIQTLVADYNIDEVIFEDIQQQNNVANNVQTFKVLAEVYGVVSELLQELQIPHSTVLAASWKSTLGIKGRTRAEQKKNAQLYVEQNYGIHVIQDIADAVCIGTHHIEKNKCAWEGCGLNKIILLS